MLNKDVQIDHAIPESRGGDDHVGNLVICCQFCNVNKAVRTPEEFKAMINRYSETQLEKWPGDEIDIKFDKSWKTFQAEEVSNKSELDIKRAAGRLKRMANLS